MSERSTASAYSELVAAIVKAVPEIRNEDAWHEWKGKNVCSICSTDQSKDGWEQNCLRPITLEDVLRTLEYSYVLDKHREIGIDSRGSWLTFDGEWLHADLENETKTWWSIGKPLSEQTDECKLFLHKLLCV